MPIGMSTFCIFPAKKTRTHCPPETPASSMHLLFESELPLHVAKYASSWPLFQNMWLTFMKMKEYHIILVGQFLVRKSCINGLRNERLDACNMNEIRRFKMFYKPL